MIPCVTSVCFLNRVVFPFEETPSFRVMIGLMSYRASFARCLLCFIQAFSNYGQILDVRIPFPGPAHCAFCLCCRFVSLEIHRV